MVAFEMHIELIVGYFILQFHHFLEFNTEGVLLNDLQLLFHFSNIPFDFLLLCFALFNRIEVFIGIAVEFDAEIVFVTEVNIDIGVDIDFEVEIVADIEVDIEVDIAPSRSRRCPERRRRRATA